MTIKQQYQKARRNYLRRVNRLVKQGYLVDVIQPPKRPTKASIRRLEKETGKYIKQKSTTRLYDVVTGKPVEVQGKTHRRTVEKSNQEFTRMTPFEQETIRDMYKTGGSSGRRSFRDRFNDAFNNAETVYDYEIIIENWYHFVEIAIYPKVRDIVMMRTNDLLDGASVQEQVAFAYVRKRNPDIFPNQQDSREEVVLTKMQAVAEAMGWYQDSQEFKDMMVVLDLVEEEEE